MNYDDGDNDIKSVLLIGVNFQCVSSARHQCCLLHKKNNNYYNCTSRFFF